MYGADKIILKEGRVRKVRKRNQREGRGGSGSIRGLDNVLLTSTWWAIEEEIRA